MLLFVLWNIVFLGGRLGLSYGQSQMFNYGGNGGQSVPQQQYNSQPISVKGGEPAYQVGSQSQNNYYQQGSQPTSVKGGEPAEQVNYQTMNTSPQQVNRPISQSGGGNGFSQGTSPSNNVLPLQNAPDTFPARKACTVPNEKQNMVFTRHDCETNRESCDWRPGDVVPHRALLEVSCLPGNYLPHGEKTIVSCRDGVWDPVFPECLKRCPPLKSQTLELKCQKGYIEANCNEPMIPDTIVEYNCKPFYDSGDKFPNKVIKCNLDGSWSRDLPRCNPSCGVSNVNISEIQPAIFGGNISRPGDFPWQTNLYYRDNTTWVSKCGGTLISHRHVLTAAHCVTSSRGSEKPRLMELEDLMVAFGKSYRDWDKEESTEIKKHIHKISVPNSYFGSSLNYINDIAILVLESEVDLNNNVMPACVDFNQEHEKELKRDKTKQGYVSGWGDTEECSVVGEVCNTPSDKLKYAQTPIVFIDECHEITETLKPLQSSRLTVDKFCSGNGSESVVQQGDSGGGMTFEFGGLHYVFGVVSFKLKMKIKEEVYYNFGMFTNVSYHKEWINTQIS